jgi:hypothetical protein
MQIEARNLGMEGFPVLEQEAHRALDAALDRFESRVRRVRVRLVHVEGSADAICRIRAWCGEGATVTVEGLGDSHEEAIHAAVHQLKRALQERWRRQRVLRRRRRPRLH